MGLFSFLSEEIALDLGTANTIIICNNKIVVDEPSIVALDRRTDKLIAIGESLKNIDKITNKELLEKYPQIDWKGAKGMRDIISHHYFDIDANDIYSVCDTKLEELLETIVLIKKEL